MQKTLRVNVKTGEMEYTPVAEKYSTYGQRGLVSRFLLDEVDPACDPLGPENKLIVCTGTFAGTSFPISGRVSLGGKSPLTGTIKESSAGGTLGTQMASHGIKMIVFEDKPAEGDGWKILFVNSNGEPSLIEADEYIGLGTYAFCEEMFRRFTGKVAVMTIGPAGEMLYRSAAVLISEFGEGYPCRAAGRGGLGALMGSKKIKAVVMEKAKKTPVFEYADKERFETARAKFIELIRNNPRTRSFTTCGSTSMMNVTGTLGIVPHRNFSGLPLSDEQKLHFSSENWKEFVVTNGGRTGVACHPGCIVMCSNVVKDSDGKFLTAGYEYESVAMLGPNLEIYDFDRTAKFDFLCDDIGLDCIETGCIMGVCMEGGRIGWGDADGVEALLDEMRRGTEFGRVLGQGTESAGKALGVTRIPVVKKQGIPAYDPRGFKGNGITYCVSTQGADHTFGMVVAPGAADEDVPGLAIESQVSTAFANDFMCSFFTGITLSDPDLVPELFAAAFGGEWTMEKCMDIGRNTLRIERMFNHRAGFTADDDSLPEFFRKPGYEGGPAFNLSDEVVRKHMNDIYSYDR